MVSTQRRVKNVRILLAMIGDSAWLLGSDSRVMDEAL